MPFRITSWRLIFCVWVFLVLLDVLAMDFRALVDIGTGAVMLYSYQHWGD